MKDNLLNRVLNIVLIALCLMGTGFALVMFCFMWLDISVNLFYVRVISFLTLVCIGALACRADCDLACLCLIAALIVLSVFAGFNTTFDHNNVKQEVIKSELRSSDDINNLYLHDGCNSHDLY